MNPVKHPSNNVLCRPPKSWDDRGGKLPLPALHATKGQVHGKDVLLTYWEPTREEVAMLLAGGRVQLACVGGQPACNVSVLPPNEFGTPILLPN